MKCSICGKETTALYFFYMCPECWNTKAKVSNRNSRENHGAGN